MITDISKINSCPVAFHNRSVTIEGVCRTIHTAPFPHFLIEDKTGAVICIPKNNELPHVGHHIEIEGTFSLDTPPTWSSDIPRIEESSRTSIFHHEKCSYIGCEFHEITPTLAA
jgi:hypothetical protein